MRTQTAATASWLMALALVIFLPSIEPVHAESARREIACGTFEGRGKLDLAIHQMFRERRTLRGLPLRALSTVTSVGNIAVIEGDDKLIAQANPFDLRSRSIAFIPVGSHAYRVEKDNSMLDLSLGSPIRLGDDDSHRLSLDFPFPFFGDQPTEIFVNSDGNLTFRAPDTLADRSVSRLLAGPPRIALFFNDLDPSVGGGEVFVASLPDRLVVTWNQVSEWGEANKNTFQVVLEPSGRIVMRYGAPIDAGSAVIGLSRGFLPDDIRLVDLSAGRAEASHAIFEHFLRDNLIDSVAAVKRFYNHFSDYYDRIIFWTTFNSDTGDAFAYETTIQNQVRGIGDGIYNHASSWGSSRKLESFVFMGNIDRYPESPHDLFGGDGSLSTLGLLAHEVGHRWLARVRIQDGQSKSHALLGRQGAHWSFFFDSDASFLEGNELEDEGDGDFRSVAALSRYSRLDLYLMGLATPNEVPPFFYIDNANGTGAGGQVLTKASYPELRAVVGGDRRNLTIDDIISAEGPRQPDFRSSPKEFREVWLLLHPTNQPPSSQQIRKIEEIRLAWEAFFRSQTMGRGTVSTRLGR